MKERIVKAVHEYDLEDFLQSAGLLQDLRNGDLRCSICGETLALRDIAKFVIRGGSVGVVCHQSSCYRLEELDNDADN